MRAAGIRQVSGRVNGDATMFDSKRTGPYWKPSYWQDCPPISALSVNKSLISYFEPESYKRPVLHAATAFRGALNVRGVKVGHDSAHGAAAGRCDAGGHASRHPASRGWCC